MIILPKMQRKHYIYKMEHDTLKTEIVKGNRQTNLF